MKKLLIIPLLLTTLSLFAQNFSQHRWQDRLIIIIDNSNNSGKRFNQLALLKNDLDGLKERKLQVYQLSKTGYHKGTDQKNDWLPFTGKHKFIQKAQMESFAIYLVGLDGGIKMKKETVTSLSTIFALIDGMPMRQAEMQNKQ